MENFKDSTTYKIIVERWKGKDMEIYFEEKNKEFHNRLKEEVKNLS